MAEYNYPADETYELVSLPPNAKEQNIYLDVIPSCPPKCIKNGQPGDGNHEYKFAGFTLVQVNGNAVKNTADINVNDLSLGTGQSLDGARLRTSTLIGKINSGNSDCDPPVCTVEVQLKCNGQVIWSRKLSDVGENGSNMIFRIKLKQQ